MLGNVYINKIHAMKKKVFEDLLFLKIKLNKIVQVYKILM